eukprot:8194292-Pyramimonas_sp.AAC.2
MQLYTAPSAYVAATSSPRWTVCLPRRIARHPSQRPPSVALLQATPACLPDPSRPPLEPLWSPSGAFSDSTTGSDGRRRIRRRCADDA